MSWDLPIAKSVAFDLLFNRSQGGVKLPTGGMQLLAASPRAPSGGRVSRSGEMPEPTVIVRMKEDGRLPGVSRTPDCA